VARRPPKKADPPAAGAPAWMVTYSDMVTLLLTFFVMLLAMANFDDLVRLNAVLESIREALSMGNFDVQLSNDEDMATPWTSEPEANTDVQPVMAKLREALAEHLSDDLVRMTQKQTEIRIMLDERVLFGPNETRIHPTAYGLIGDLAAAVAEEPVDIIAEGHTDATGTQKDNWQLSVDRAVSVVMALQETGPIPGERLEARGFSHYQPADTTLGESSDWNRRVEIVIHSDQRAAYSAIEAVDELQGGTHGTKE
jgi:chemotaxis protein MotB